MNEIKLTINPDLLEEVNKTHWLAFVGRSEEMFTIVEWKKTTLSSFVEVADSHGNVEWFSDLGTLLKTLVLKGGIS